MKIPVNQDGLSIFVVGRPGPEYCLPVAVYMKMRCSSSLSRAPPRWVIGTGQLGRLRFRAGPIARRGAAA